MKQKQSLFMHSFIAVLAMGTQTFASDKVDCQINGIQYEQQFRTEEGNIKRAIFQYSEALTLVVESEDAQAGNKISLSVSQDESGEIASASTARGTDINLFFKVNGDSDMRINCQLKLESHSQTGH